MTVKDGCRRSLEKLEREKGFEPSTLALARRCSTTELFPPVRRWSSVGWQYINEPFVCCQDICQAPGSERIDSPALLRYLPFMNSAELWSRFKTYLNVNPTV